jgi:DNA-binding NarL/FixJ family response regulator
MRSINEFLQDGTEDRPELILLDQHWMEMRPDELLERTARKYGGSKIVVFTGKPLDAPLILNCARFGVADYIQKGSTTPEALAKRIHLIALDDALCVDKLRLLSGSQKQLLQDGDSGPSRTGFRGESEQHSGLKANRIPVVNRTSIPV